MKMKKKLVTLLKLFMLVVFISYYGEVIAFSHIHFLPDRVITHSHPFLPGHSHSSTEFETITELSTLSCIEFIPFILFCALVIFCVLILEKSWILPNIRTYNYLLRAPPYCIRNNRIMFSFFI